MNATIAYESQCPERVLRGIVGVQILYARHIRLRLIAIRIILIRLRIRIIRLAAHGVLLRLVLRGIAAVRRLLRLRPAVQIRVVARILPGHGTVLRLLGLPVLRLLMVVHTDYLLL